MEQSADPDGTAKSRTWAQVRGDGVEEVCESVRRWIDGRAGVVWETSCAEQRGFFKEVVAALRSEGWAVITHVQMNGGHQAHIWRPGDTSAAAQIKAWVEPAREEMDEFRRYLKYNRLFGYPKEVEPRRKLNLKHPYLVAKPPRTG